VCFVENPGKDLQCSTSQGGVVLSSVVVLACSCEDQINIHNYLPIFYCGSTEVTPSVQERKKERTVTLTPFWVNRQAAWIAFAESKFREKAVGKQKRIFRGLLSALEQRRQPPVASRRRATVASTNLQYRYMVKGILHSCERKKLVL
jgi:hypothetical protein